MCLIINNTATKDLLGDFLSKGDGKGNLTFYKVYARKTYFGGWYTLSPSALNLWSPYKNIAVNPDKQGYIVSDRNGTRITDYENSCNTVHYGIHVYRSLKAVKLDGWDVKSNHIVVVKVKGNIRDFVAASKEQAVFTQIKVNVPHLKSTMTKLTKKKTVKKTTKKISKKVSKKTSKRK